jgi:hypothetical protein
MNTIALFFRGEEENAMQESQKRQMIDDPACKFRNAQCKA